MGGNNLGENQSYRRKSIRLKGFDYSQPGEYFITICTMDRVCILGEVIDGVMRLSEKGRIVETCWNEISMHYPNVRTDVFQIMPNHIHAIIEIKKRIYRRGEVISPTSWKGDATSPLRKTTLGSVVAYFKYRATKRINESDGTPGKHVFQRSFYDHIIRRHVDRFFIEQYIEINPLMWEVDSNNAHSSGMSVSVLKERLRKQHGLDELSLERIISTELSLLKNNR